MYKLKNIKLTNLLGISCLSILILLTLVIVSPNAVESVDATTDSTILPASVENKQILSLSLDKNSIYFGEITATEAGQFQQETVNVKVASNAEKGFKLYVSTTEDTTAMSNVSTSGGEIMSIGSVITTDAIGTNFPMNAWGFNIVDGKDSTVSEYKPINALGSVDAATSTTMPSSKDYTLGFAMKLDTTLPAGTYRNNMMVSAVTDPERILTLNDITTMQEMTHEICSNTLAANAASLPVGEKQLVTPGNEASKQLKDVRDNKWYWVSKLADQNCWMTQNLDLDIPETPSEDFIAKSDNIPAGWRPSAGTIVDNNFTIGNNSTSYSWDIGDWRIVDPNVSEACLFYSGESITSKCAKNIASTPNLADSAVIDDQTMHYHIGNYYQQYAAAVGADKSICPRGWSQQVAESSNKLVNIYMSGKDISDLPRILVTEPLYFTKGGGVYISGNVLHNFDYESIYWNGTESSVDSGYAFNFFGAGSYDPNRAIDKYYGFPVRCVAR